MSVHPDGDVASAAVAYRCAVTDERGAEAGAITFVRTPRYLHLEQLDVAPAYRRRGIATALVRAVLQQAAEWELRKVMLQVVGTNPACRVYQRLGFQDVGTRHAPNGEHLRVLLYEWGL